MCKLDVVRGVSTTPRYWQNMVNTLADLRYTTMAYPAPALIPINDFLFFVGLPAIY